jgi:hypothetical protein
MLLIATALVTVLGFSAPTFAAPYPPGGSVVTTDQGSYPPGGHVTITGSGDCKGGTMTFTIYPPGGGAPTVLTGAVSYEGTASVVFDGTELVGKYTVVMTCPGMPTATTTFTVGTITKTGSDSAVPLRIGFVLLVLGIGLVVVAKRRRSHSVASA